MASTYDRLSTALMKAAENGHTDVVTALLAAGADINATYLVRLYIYIYRFILCIDRDTICLYIHVSM